jgi:hypothetical protein
MSVQRRLGGTTTKRRGLHPSVRIPHAAAGIGAGVALRRHLFPPKSPRPAIALLLYSKPPGPPVNVRTNVRLR